MTQTKLSTAAKEFILSRTSGFYEVHRDDLRGLRTADALVKRGWMSKNEMENKNFAFEYTLTFVGREAYNSVYHNALWLAEQSAAETPVAVIELEDVRAGSPIPSREERDAYYAELEAPTDATLGDELYERAAPKKDTFTPRGYGPIALDYIKVKLILDAMEDLLTRTQYTRILKATENGGFDAGLKSLARVSAQIANERKALSNAHAALMDRVDTLEAAHE